MITKEELIVWIDTVNAEILDEMARGVADRPLIDKEALLREHGYNV